MNENETLTFKGVTATIPMKLTDHEIAEKAKEVAQREREIADINDDERDVRLAYKSQRNKVMADRNAALACCEDGVELRSEKVDIECDGESWLFKRGKEVLHQRKVEAHERQHLIDGTININEVQA